MSIQDQLLEAMKVAMKAKDSLRLSTIRMARAAVKNAEIEVRQELDETAVIKILSTLVKQRREAAEAYRETRPELAEKEELELAVLQEFLPAQLSETEVEELIVKAVVESGASSMRDMGAVMKLVTPQTTGRADGKMVSNLVRKKLAG
ncbi:MAG: GatB/YqeY domain-containing protein [Deltaproteobacteria bacterium]|nr:GatB/YqeY domain-containing protein [Deltaproteobacteria bacterium]RLB68105.1 MAG: GatB/YqeY domain-containing protein [Deltaproteobacteria bacterium]